MGAHLQRALVLFGQSRPDLAEAELKQELAAEPDSAWAHALLGLCLVHRKDYAQAAAEVDAAVRHQPDLGFAHYARATVFELRNRFADRLEPYEPDSHARLASIRLHQRDWRGALDAASGGLAIDPEHVELNNLRTHALVQLGRRTEATDAIRASLSRNPDNAVTHATLGWTLLEKGQAEEALGHFREALRLDPELEFARQGIVEALKARHFVYRNLLAWFLWMSKLSRQAQWGIIIGGYVGAQYLRGLAGDHPDWALWIWPLIAAYYAFAVMTWIADPLFNLLLRLNRFGRLALSREQVVVSNWVGGCLAIALGALGLWIATGMTETSLAVAALFAGLLVLPVAGTFRCPRGWPRWTMAGITASVAAAGVAGYGILLAAATENGGPGLLIQAGQFLLQGAFLGIIASQFAANALAAVRVRR